MLPIENADSDDEHDGGGGGGVLTKQPSPTYVTKTCLRITVLSIFLLLMGALFYSPPSHKGGVTTHQSMEPVEAITQAEVETAQNAWGAAFAALRKPADAERFVTSFYAFGHLPTLFKPTTAAVTTEKAAAVQYFASSAQMMSLSSPPVVFDNKAFINDHASGRAFVYGQFTLHFKTMPPPVVEKLKTIHLELNADGTSLTFDYSMGFVRVGKSLKLFFHHNVWRSTPSRR